MVLLLFASILIFALIRLAPGDPVDIMYGASVSPGTGQVSKAIKEQLRQELGLNQPITIQYLRWLGRAIRFDFGTSFRTRKPVSEELVKRIPATFLLAGTAFAIQALLVFVLGILSAIRAHTWVDHLVHLLAMLFVSVPPFLLGLLLLVLFASELQWVRVSGGASLRQLILPAIVLALNISPQPIRILQTSLMAEFNRLYMVFGRSKGLSETRIVARHALLNASLPVLTMLGMNLCWLLGGVAIVESVFTWPGVGHYAVWSISVRDYPVIQGYMMLTTLIVIVTNFMVDILYTIIDPRIRLSAVA